MSEALSKYTDVKYVLINGADHASICWNETSCKEVAEFVNSKATNAEAAKNVKVRRGKRDKMPMCQDESIDTTESSKNE